MSCTLGKPRNCISLCMAASGDGTPSFCRHKAREKCPTKVWDSREKIPVEGWRPRSCRALLGRFWPLPSKVQIS